MEAAKKAVSSFVSRDGKHKTTVNEDIAQAVTNEHVRPHQHENVTTAVDKEIHQDHHHTTVQPIKTKETLPEEHTHNIIPVEHKTFQHGNERDLRAALDREAAKFKDSSVTHSTTHSTSTAPIVTGERIHHHVHEHIQPVIEKETVAPKVVHTTVPIHETHHAAAVHHGTSTLPPTTLEEFKANRGVLEGRGNFKVDEFDGCPKPYRKDLQSEQAEGDRSMHLNSGSSHAGAGMRSGLTGTTGFAGTAGTSGTSSTSSMSSTTGRAAESETHTGLGRNGGLGAAAGLGSPVNSGHTGGTGRSAKVIDSVNASRTTGPGRTSDSARTAGLGRNTVGGYQEGKAFNKTEPGYDTGVKGHRRGDSGVDFNDAYTEAKKPSLMDKLNPLKDADGDGKKGLMD